MGTARAGVGIMEGGVNSPEQLWRNLIPIVMAGVNGIYGLITSIIIHGSIVSPNERGNNRYSLYSGAAHLAAGLCCGLSSLGSGVCIGIAGEAAVKTCGVYEVKMKRWAKRPTDANKTKNPRTKALGDKIFVAMVLVQVFAGNIALYGLIASIMLTQQVYYCGDQ